MTEPKRYEMNGTVRLGRLRPGVARTVLSYPKEPPERRPAALAARPRGPGGRSADKRREVGKGLSLADTQTGR